MEKASYLQESHIKYSGGNSYTKSKNDKNFTNKSKSKTFSSSVLKEIKDLPNKYVLSCNTNSIKNNPVLPQIGIKFHEMKYLALLDTGANISLVQPSVIQEIKQHTKVEYISRSVKIHAINNTTIPYLSAVNLKFKIGTKWFTNMFFVTHNNWSSTYKIILGYDFIQRNQILLDIPNDCFIVNNSKFQFETPLDTNKISNSTTEESDETINNILAENISVKLSENIVINPNSTEIIKLTIPSDLHGSKQILFSPLDKKAKYCMSESIHDLIGTNNFYTIIENKTANKIHIRKGTKLGNVSNLIDFEISIPSEEQVFQINNLSAEEISTLRKDEITESDFKLEHMHVNDKNKMLKFLLDNFKVFSKSYKTLGSTDAVKPDIKLLHNFPIQTRPYPIPKIAKQFAQKEIAQLLEAGIIKPTSSSYAFPVIFVRKKSPQSTPESEIKFRMVVDYRLLNSITESFKICLPKINEILHNIAGKKLYCVLDLKAAFFQIQLQEKDMEKLAFCSEIGNFCPTRLPFGLRNSTSYFHSVLYKCLKDIVGSNIQFFLDDIIVAADTIDQMMQLLQKIFDNLISYNLTLDPKKLQICQTEITYLGFTVNQNGFSPSKDNINKVTSFPIPTNTKQVQMFLGTLNYFRHMIFDYSKIIQPIVKLTRKNTPFVWSQECQEAFDLLQNTILNKPTIKNIDNNKPLYLVTDASKSAVCGILMHKIDEKFLPVEFFSKTLSETESRYPSIRRELFAIYLAVKHFRTHLYGKKFFILTDAKPLTYHLPLNDQPEIVARWYLYLQEFDYSVEHIPGLKNPADFLSRVVTDSVIVNNITMFATNSSLSLANIAKHQKADPKIKLIIENINKNENCSSKQYSIDKSTDLVMIKIKPSSRGSKNKKLVNKIVIPKSLIQPCIEAAHNPHFGTQKTYNFLRYRYFWKGMFKDVKKFCENCSECLKYKPKSKCTEFELISKKHLAPGQMIAIDIVGKLPRSNDNKFYILTIIDHYSRFLQAYSVTNCSSHTIIKCLNDYFSIFGLCKILLTDNATYFRSHEIENFLANLNIEHRKSSIYYPQSNGTLERSHRILKESIAAMSQKICDWSKHLLYFKLHYNNSIHAVTKFTPAELFCGRKQIIPIDANSMPMYVSDFSEYVKKANESMKENRKIVEQNETSYFSQHSKHIKGRKKPNLQLGDHVFLTKFKEPLSLEAKYNGPYEIIKTLRNDNYIIKHLEDVNAGTIKVHVSKLFKQGNVV